jgi:hypothetical protein
MSVKISKAAVQRGVKAEHSEHPWATMAQAKHIATDHLKLHPNEYPPKKRR